MVRSLAVGLLLSGVALLFAKSEEQPPEAAPQVQQKVFHILPHELDQMEDNAYAAFLSKSFRKARSQSPNLIIVEVNTPGGELGATLKIKNIILGSSAPTVCFINTNAISAGSLIALSCDKIVMAPGGIIGAATPIFKTSDGVKKAPEKFLSAARAAWRGAAEANNKNPDIAEAFVDENVILTKKKHGISKKKGTLLTLTTKEAVKVKIADYSATNIHEIVKQEGIIAYSTKSLEPEFIDKLLAFFLHPAVSGILIGLGFLGLMYELKVPGWGIPGSLGLLFLSLYFGSRILIGESGWGAPALFAFGILLLLLEVFVIPGFGVAGILGLVALFVSILWTYGATEIHEGLWVLAIGVVGAVGFGLLGLKFLPQVAGRTSSLFLNEVLPADEQENAIAEYVGKDAVTRSTLRPAGIIEVAGRRIDAVSNGDYIEAGEAVRILEVQGNRVVVEAV